MSKKIKPKNNIILLDFKTTEEKEPHDIKFHIRQFADMVIFCVSAFLIGLVTGAADALFGIVLLDLTGIRQSSPIYFIPFLAPAGILIYFIYDRFGKETQNGMSLLFERARNNRTEIKLRLIPFVTLSTWMTHLFGGSAGREGVAVQIGGTIGSFTAKGLKIKNKNTAKILTISGMAAGFGGLFRTPLAAVFFASEVMTVGTLEVSALLPSIIAAYTASTVSGLLGLEKFSVDLNLMDTDYDIKFYVLLCISGILFGIVGGLFAYVLPKCKKLLSALLKNPYLKIGLTGALISIASLLLYSGRYSGLGTNLITEAFGGGEIYAWDFVLKFIFTIVTLSAGFQGGEVTPLFSIGASLGAVLAAASGMPVLLFAAFGYAAVFGAAANTLIAPILIGAEVFGYEYIPFFFVVCSIAYVCNSNNSIYSLQLKKQS